MRFEFATATRIVFGLGVLREVGPIAKDFGTRALIVTGRDSTRAEPLLQLLAAENISTVTFSVPTEPSIEVVEAATTLARKEQCDFVIGFGGGSALDAGKSAAIMLTNSGELLDYLEVIGRGKQLANPSAPFIAIPTTSGTGAEVTRNAVLASPAHRTKVSLRSALMLPKVALIDPELTRGLPPGVTANSGLDALTQLIEPFLCHRANPISDSFCKEGIPRAARSLARAVENGNDITAREDMSLASMFGGLALSSAGLGAVHGFANPIGGMFDAPHGAICAALLPHVMELNLRALRQRTPQSETLRRFDEVAQLLTGNTNATADDGIKWIQNLANNLKTAPLGSYGISPNDFPDLIEKASKASSMKANPVALTSEELTEILRRAI